jgi:uncharacterized protein (DUF58 family)
LKSLRQAATRRWRAWLARRFGVDALPYSVERRRIYILPSASGLQCALLVVAMLAAGFNYGSNLALGFAFLMASLALVCMHHCHRNLLGLEFDAGATADAFAGEAALIECTLRNPAGVARWDLEIRCGDPAEARSAPGGSVAGGAAAPLEGLATGSVAARGTAALAVSMPTPGRGVYRLQRVQLATRHPFGWFRAWTYVQAPLTIFVAPVPRGARLGASPSGQRGATASAELAGDEDFAGLRLYAPGLALKHMAWKVLARGREPSVRHYTAAAAEPQWLDWFRLEGLASEPRLSQLCRWVLDASAMQRIYGLRLPSVEIAPDSGPRHRLACLRALAAFRTKPGP